MKKGSKKNQQNAGLVIMTTTTPGAGELATAGAFTREQVPTLMAQIEAQMAALKGEKEEATKVTEELDGFGKIQDITDVSELRRAYAFVTNTFKAIEAHNSVFEEAAPTSKLASFKISGYGLDSWQKTIVGQYKEVVYKDQLDKLSKARKVLQNYLTEDQKLNSELADLKELFSTKD